MRTEILVNGVLPEYCSATGRDGNANTVARSLHHQGKFAKSGQNHGSSQTTKDGIFGYGKEEIRKTILKHETVFRNQVRELHRLCIRQRELMNEMKTAKLNKVEHSIPFISLIQESKILTSSDIPLPKSISFEKRTDSFEIPANVLRSNVENEVQKSFYEFPVVETNIRNRNHQTLFANSAFTGAWRPERKVDSPRPCYQTDLNLTSLADGIHSTFSCLGRADVSVNSEEKRFEKHSFTGDFRFGESHTCSKGTAQPRNGFSDNHLSTCKSASRRKQTLFGVEISGENDDPLGPASNISGIIKKNDLVNCKDVGYGAPGKCFKNEEDTNAKPIESSKGYSENSQKFEMVGPQQNLMFTDYQSNKENPKGELPWFLKTPQQRGEPKKGANNSYFMNLDSLQNHSIEFFKKTETTGGSLPNLKAKQETSEPMAVLIADDGIPRTILGFPICNALDMVKNPNSGGSVSKVNCSCIDGGGRKEELEIKDFVLQKGFNNYISGLRHHIDLNLSSEEEDAPPAPSIPTAIVKIATTEIDLEAPTVIESEAEVSPTEADSTEMEVPPPRKSEPSNEECDRIAAQTIISFSMSGKKNSNEVACEPLEATSSDCLKWFAEKILSNCDDTIRAVSLVQNGVCDADGLLPYGMDYFEFMTLKLEDTKEEDYSYKPMESHNPSDEETKRSRKGMPSRGTWSGHIIKTRSDRGSQGFRSATIQS
ncbi:uncharacterized protein [Henckelia pumila]|uniref:uncharacterized protein n=1 Tax=Henckelia pumila TaxID=405737 RepID=UPI003C6DE8F7